MMWLKALYKRWHLRHRYRAYKLLDGHGLEIGALHQPAWVPGRCRVEYCDAISKAEAVKIFAEIPAEQIVNPGIISDLDKDGLSAVMDESYDFVIFNHVIEHVANPVRVVEELFRVVRPGGLVVLSAPDKNYTYDVERDLTPFAHLEDEYRAGVSEVSDEHYLDFIRGVHPEMLGENNENVAQAIAYARDRREHVHVWDSVSFKDFLKKSFALLAVESSCLYEVSGEKTRFEYFSVWRKFR